MSHSCYSEFISLSSGTVQLKYIKTAASNIKILSFSRKYQKKTLKTVSASGEYGMNGSWFAISSDNHIMNLAYQNGVRQGYFINDSEVTPVNGVMPDGFTNSVGSSLIYCKNGQVNYSSNVTSSSSSLVTGSTWAQGGIGLYLCNVNGYNKFVQEDSTYATGTAARSALVANTNTNMVYLITTPTEVTVKNFRLAIMDNFAISEGAQDIWKGILLDGGGSTQLLGSDVQVSSSRSIPQMIALVEP